MKQIKLMRALARAQRAALGKRVPATAVREERKGSTVRRTRYTSADDVVEFARGILLQQKLVVQLEKTEIAPPAFEGAPAFVTIHVDIFHTASSEGITRTYQVELGAYGATGATCSGFAMALRLILLLPREAQSTQVELDDEELFDNELPRSTERVVFPAPMAAAAAAGKTDAEVRESAKAACFRIVNAVMSMDPTRTVQSLRADAKLPLDGDLTTLEWVRFEEHLEEMLREAGPRECDHEVPE